MPVIDGKVVRARYTALKLGELSSVDRPAQPGALATIMKRADPPVVDPAVVAEVAKYVCEDDGAHTFTEVLTENEFSDRIWPYTDALVQSIRSIVGDGSLSGGERETKVKNSVDEFLAAVRQISPETEKRLSQLVKQGGATMPKSVEELQGEIDTLKSQNTTLTSERDAALAKATTAEEDKKKAMEECATAKAALITATDEVLTVDGTEIRKSVVGEASFTVNKALLGRAEMAEFEKRAETEFRHVVGTAVDKAKVLKAASVLPEETKKAFDAILNAAEKMSAQGFGSLGTNGGTATPTAKAAEATFMGKVSEIAKRDGIPQYQAMQKARTECPEEFAAYTDGQ
jgi:hypothetical protein